MTIHTLREALVAGIKQAGGKFDGETGRYWIYTMPDQRQYYVGPLGALLTGPTMAGATSLTGSPPYQRLVAAGRAKLAVRPG